MQELGETMSAHELMEWAAYERVYGPLLSQDRIDLGFAKLSYYIVSLLSSGRKRYKFRDFLPKWITDQIRRAPTDEEKLGVVFQSWVKETDADDLDPNGRRSVEHE